MATKTFVLLIFTLISPCFPLAKSVHFNFPAVLNFGDSNSDTGGLVSAGIESINPPYGQNYFKIPSGRYCDGRLIVDFLSKFFGFDLVLFCYIYFLFLCFSLFPLFLSLFFLLLLLFLINISECNDAVDAMDLPFLNSYLDSIGTPSFRRGCNFAAAGSTILPATATSVSPFSFGVQVSQFLRFKARALELLAKGVFMDNLESLSYISIQNFSCLMKFYR